MNELPQYLRTVRALAFAAGIGTAITGCASAVYPDDGSIARTDARRSDSAGDAVPTECPTTMPTQGGACREGCTYGMNGSCNYCECNRNAGGQPAWNCLFCGGPCPPPDLAV